LLAGVAELLMVRKDMVQVQQPLEAIEVGLTVLQDRQFILQELALELLETQGMVQLVILTEALVHLIREKVVSEEEEVVLIQMVVVVVVGILAAAVAAVAELAVEVAEVLTLLILMLQ
jgi:hypothetical protein